VGVLAADEPDEWLPAIITHLASRGARQPTPLHAARPNKLSAAPAANHRRESDQLLRNILYTGHNPRREKTRTKHRIGGLNAN